MSYPRVASSADGVGLLGGIIERSAWTQHAWRHKWTPSIGFVSNAERSSACACTCVDRYACSWTGHCSTLQHALVYLGRV